MPDRRYRTLLEGQPEEIVEILDEQRPLPLSDYDVRALLLNLTNRIQALEERFNETVLPDK